MTRILVVDDELEVREVVKTALQRNGYQVMEAADGIEAYAAAADAAVAEKPNLIVLDLMLPKLNGFEALEKLKQNPQTSSRNTRTSPPHWRGWHPRSPSLRSTWPTATVA